MENLDRIRMPYGSVKLADGTILNVGGEVNDEVMEKVSKDNTLVNAFGIASKARGKQHAVVMEGYVYKWNGLDKQFFTTAVTAYNSGCRGAVNHYWTRLRHPNSRVTCARCQKRIESGLI